ncbi:23S rRNA pseudouridine2605 synthase [Novosphingobium kunmingense]|uniref:Pseudouridine synthase n=1 Tax=Novosphingobium kunmingense TaxID=1211806 RepID=A0A2N0I1A6_9SPHN|nr:23S rRNA pseudouridine2605 synthase [Novosphingobium kunmingense]
MTKSDDSPRTGDRIAKLLARAGVASRREVERMIAEGRVKIGDDVVTTPATLLTNLKRVSVDGKPVKAPEPPRIFIFHKPSGLITAERDPAGRPTIYTALRNALPPDARRVMPIGRLDFNTEGLLLLTNDGGLKRTMELPATGLPRTYRARTFGDITQAQLDDLIEGVEIDGVRYGKINANLERSTGRNQWIEVTITEGKNREVRRVLEHLGLEVSRLIRTAYGPFELLDLPRGAAVEIRQVEVERFIRNLKVPGSVPAEQAPRDADTMARARVHRARRAAPSDTPRAPAKAAKRPLPRKPRDDGKLVDRPTRAGSARRGSPKSGPRKPGPRK